MSRMRQGLGVVVVVMVVGVLLAPQGAGQAVAGREPHLGYVFPAGAKIGTRVEVLLGGQNLRGSSQVVVSGAPGVSARVIKTYRAVRNFDKEQREEIQRLIAVRRAVLAGKPVPPVVARAADAPALVMPEHPLLDRLGRADAAELEHLVQVFLRSNKMQVNVQLGEMVTLEVAVAAAAPPGVRELRLLTATGLSNPLRFEAGTMDEVCEREPNDPKPGRALSPQVAAVPVVINGQVLPGDVDRLRFHARRGQSLVVEVQARSLIPYLADAVPGWFQPVLSVFDPRGKELAYGDDYRFRPDPVLMFRVPDDGDYALELRDALFRGREDFVYRIKVSEQPFVTACFPLGAATGSKASANLTGWNLPRAAVVLDTRPGAAGVREFVLTGAGLGSNPVAYAVDDLPDVAEGEPNDEQNSARLVPWPCAVNGRIHKPGDVDVFRLAAPAGAGVVIDVWARRLGSPLDSVVRVTDAAGKVLAWNDDFMVKDGNLQLGDGLLTHHADSRVCLVMPAKGPCFVQIEDAQHHGGEAYGYRLRISPGKPDFALRVTPSGINLAAGQCAPVTVHIDRRDGFDGEVVVSLADLDAGWRLSGNVVPPGRERLSMTVQVPADAAPGVQPFKLSGKADIGGVGVTRVAEACDDTMQAFLWRHLVPARECLVAVMAGKARMPLANRIGTARVEIPSGGEAVMSYRVPAWIARQGGVEVVAVDLPDGLTMRSETMDSGEIAVHLAADAAKLKPAAAGNLILGAALKPQMQTKVEKKPARARNGVVPVVVLPAVPFVIQPAAPQP